MILDALRSVSGKVKENEDEFVRILQETSQSQQKETLKASKKRLIDNDKRITALNGIIRKLYEDYLSETLTKKRFELLTGDYEAEQEALEQQNIELQSELGRLSEQERNVDSFLELVKRYTDFTELTTPMLNEFVEKIVIYEKEKHYRKPTTQRVDIYLNFVGKVELCEIQAEIDKRNTAPIKKRVAKNTYFKPFGEYLEQQTDPSLKLTYTEIERIIGRKLCPSAYKHKSYWYPRYSSPTANVIFNSGYDIDWVDMQEFVVWLRKPVEVYENAVLDEAV